MLNKKTSELTECENALEKEKYDMVSLSCYIQEHIHQSFETIDDINCLYGNLNSNFFHHDLVVKFLIHY